MNIATNLDTFIYQNINKYALFFVSNKSRVDVTNGTGKQIKKSDAFNFSKVSKLVSWRRKQVKYIVNSQKIPE